jgi:hypothetical protein
VFTKSLSLALISVLSQMKLVHAIEPTSYFFNSISPSGKYMYHLLYQSVNIEFTFMDLVGFSV